MELPHILSVINNSASEDELRCHDGKSLSAADLKKVDVDLYAVRGYVAYALEAVSYLYDRTDVEIRDASGTFIGMLCLTHSDEPVRFDEMSLARFAAYLKDADDLTAFVTRSHVFKHDYAVIEERYIVEYEMIFKEGTAIWGGYVHASANKSHVPYKKTVNAISAAENVSLPTEEHRRGITRALASEDHFDRFLKKYHQLELWLDYVFVDKIKENATDVREAVRTIQSYSSSEISRLKYLLHRFCDDLSPIEKALGRVHLYDKVAYEMFEEWAKDGNPITESNSNKIWNALRAGKISFGDVGNAGLSGKGSNQDKYNKFVVDLAAYWIYRMRCCIAHRRIGELVISQKHEEFCCDFVEGVLDAVMIQVFKKRL